MTLKGKIVIIDQVDFNSENKRSTYEILTDNSSSGRLYLNSDDRVPKEGDSILAITDSDGNALNYTFND
jgi:uncharacterized protein VirK/YbjX